MQRFFWICLFSIIAGLLIRIPFGGGGILLSDVLLPIFALFYLAKAIFVDRRFVKSTFLKSGIFFLFFAFFSYLLGAWDLFLKEKILSISYLIRFFSILVFGMATIDFVKVPSNEKQTKKNTETFFKNLWIVSGLIIFFGFVQFYFLPDIGKFSTLGGFDPHVGRFLGTWMDPNFVAGFLSFVIPILLGKFYQTKDQKEKILLGVLSIIFLYALFLTFSRSGYLALITGFFFFFCWRDPKIILLGILISLLGLGFNERAQKRTLELMGTMKSVVLRDTDEIDPTANLRIESWTKSLELWKKYPVMGIGYNTYRFRASEEGIVDETYFSAGGSDSTLLTVLVTTGVLGFFSFLYFYACLWGVNFWRFLRTKNEIFLGFVAGLSGLLVHSFFVNSFLFPHIFLVVIFVAGILDVMKEK